MTATASTTMLKTTWPNATITVWGGTEISVILKSNDIQATIASAVAKLNNNNNELTKTIKVLIPPYGIDDEKSGGTSSNSIMSIVFVIDGATTATDHNNNNLTKLLQLLPWPSGSTVSVVPGDQNTTVIISISNDPRDDMRSVKQVLSENLDLRLLVNPYLRVDMLQIKIINNTTEQQQQQQQQDRRNRSSSIIMSIVFVIDGADHNYYYNNKNINTSNTTTNTTAKMLLLLLLPWPSGSTVSVVPGDRNTTVTISISNDPLDDMRSVKQVLSENLDLRLLVDPYLIQEEVINNNSTEQQQQDRRSSGIGGKSDANPNDENNNNDNNLLVIVIVVVVCSMLLCVGIAATVYFQCMVTNKKKHNNNTGTSMVHEGGSGSRCEYIAIDNTFQNIRIVTGEH